MTIVKGLFVPCLVPESESSMDSFADKDGITLKKDTLKG